jgi:sulfatase maturation enzyme AslB (radical SAM superfamily)
MNKNIFCVAPFVNLSTTNNGKVRLCCQSKTLDKLHVNKHNLDEIWQGEAYNRIRNQFLNNEWPAECITCKNNEDKDIPSRRDFENKKWTKIEKKPYPTQAVDFPWAVDLRLGNLCNLKCIMCTPDNSNTWYDEYENFEHLQFFKKDENVRWPFHTSFLDNYEEWVSKVRVLYFSGGEPLLIKKHRQIIEFLIEKDLAKNIILWYDTNGTYIDQEWIDMWSHFEEVNLSLSIDGGKEINEYIRHPINHDDLLTNYKLLAGSPDNIKVRLQIAVGALNIFELDKITQYSKEFNFLTFFNISIVFWPNFMTLEALPQSIIDQAAEKYKNHYNARIRNMTKNLIHDPIKLKELKEYLVKIDELRGLDHEKIFKHLYVK